MSDWLILLSIMFFRSVHAVAKGKSFLLFNFWVVFHCVDIPWLFYPLIVYHSECEVLTSSVFLRNPQKLMYPFKALITLVKILNVKAETSTLRFVRGFDLSPNLALKLQQRRTRNNQKSSTFLFSPSEDLHFLQLTHTCALTTPLGYLCWWQNRFNL